MFRKGKKVVWSDNWVFVDAPNCVVYVGIELYDVGCVIMEELDLGILSNIELGNFA